MNTWIKTGVVALSLMIGTGAMAADQVRKQDRVKDQKKDGSCKIIQIELNGNLLAADQLRDRDRDQLKDQKKDGSCKSITSGDHGNLIAADQTKKRERKQDRLKDGSCQSL